MNKLSFFKGILIASILSVVFWTGAVFIVINFDDTEVQEEPFKPEEVEDNIYAML